LRFFLEGEKDVNTLRARNIPATCNPMGAGKWRDDFGPIFDGADVVICGDNDQPGRDHVALVAKNLHGVARRVRVLELKSFWPEIEESDDITDWFEAGHSVEQLWSFVDQVDDWHPSTMDRMMPRHLGRSRRPPTKTTTAKRNPCLSSTSANGIQSQCRRDNGR
jgi:DNA primase